MSQPLTILFISHSSALYGAERSLLDLLKGLDRSRFTPVVALPAEGPLAERLRENGIETHITGHQNWMGGKYFYVAAVLRFVMNCRAFLSLRRWMKGRRIDLIYTNTSATPIGGLLSRVAGIPHLWHIREFIPKGTGGKFYYGNRFSFDFINKASTIIVCNSHHLAGEMKPYLSADKVRVVHNGILGKAPVTLIDKIAPSRAKGVMLGMVGSLGANKGITDGIEALARVNAAGIRAKLILAGDGLEKNKAVLRATANRLGVNKQIEWLGYVDDPAVVYKRAHLILVCSRWESFGRVAVEAGAQGCPVIATRRGGLIEVLEEGKTGFFYEPGDIQSLSRQIIALIDAPARYQQLSGYAQTSVYNRFTTHRYIDQIQQLMLQAAGPKTGFPNPAPKTRNPEPSTH